MWDTLCVEEFLSLIKNSNIVITGTSSGIGYQLVKKLLINNNKIWGCSRKGNKVNKKNYFHSKVDLSNSIEIESWVKKIAKDTNKRIDIFISNAAIFKRQLNPLETFSSISQTININLVASMLLTNMISKLMIQNKKGMIIFFSSVATIVNEIGSSAYASSKSGVETFSQIIKKELEKFNVKVATLRILYFPTKLSGELNTKEIKVLKKKFNTNKFGTIDKVLNQINKLNSLKKIPNKNLFYDKTK